MLSAKRLVFVTGVVASVLFAAGPAAAVFTPVPPPGGAHRGSNTEMTMTGTGPGKGVTGFIANADNPFDPLSGYPASNPVTGFAPKDEGFAGVIHGTPVPTGPTLNLYCIDILTLTNVGIGYELGTWEDSNVPNVGYVARILNEYYPATDQPASLTDPNQKAAAVQAAIWFFSDRYVLNTSEGAVHTAAAAIAAHVIALGPLVQPPPPSLTITPTTVSGATGSAVGPFTVTSATTGSATVIATGADMFADAAATQPITPDASVPSGTKIWLKSTGPDSALLEATAEAVVPSGNVYLYDGNSAGVNDAQRLILAKPARLETTVSANAEFVPTGSLTVTKTITGSGAGQQGPITITVTCNGTVLDPVFTIAAHHAAGNVSHTYTNIPAGSVCSVVETVDGHTATINVRKARSGEEIVIPAGGTASINITDTYGTGSLIVNKTITGTGAGAQGAVTIKVVCGGVAQPVFTIAAGTAAGTVSKAYPGILAGTVCTVTETAGGATKTVSVTASGSPQNVTIAANGSGTANITDTYHLSAGALVVTKTVAGTAAGQQGRIAILIDCGAPPHVFAFLIAPGAPAGPVPRTIDGIPGGSTCIVTEVVQGGTSTVSVMGTGTQQTVTVAAGATARADMTDTFQPLAPATLPPTGGSGDGGNLIMLALAACGLGIALVFVSRRRAGARSA